MSLGHYSVGLSSAALLVLLLGCGHHRDVRPGADNQHRVAVKAESPEDGARDAMSQANHYCKESEKSAFVIKEQSKYMGDMDESTYKSLKAVSSVAGVISGSTESHKQYGPNANNSKRPIGTAGESVDAVAGKPYEVRMLFKCQ